MDRSQQREELWAEGPVGRPVAEEVIMEGFPEEAELVPILYLEA